MGGGGGGGILGSVGGIVGGIIGQNNANGDAGQASNEAGIANNIMQQMAAVPDISKPLVLEQYRQAGVLTPAMEKQISLGVSQASQVKANPALQAAQQQALQSMAQRSQQGLTASDRAAFNQLQQQVGSQTQGRLAAIQQQQQAQTGGHGTQGATLAAKLSAAQGGANTMAMNADQLAAQASNNALQATAQYGNMAGQQNQQQFSQQEEAAKAADSFRQFDVQNQVAQQQRNTAASNAAQQSNLNLSQNIGNANVSQANQESQAQLQREAQQWGMQDTQAVQQSQAAAGYGNTLSGMATQIAQAGANLGAGIGGVASQAFDPGASMGGSWSGGEIKKALGYASGGQVSGSELSAIAPIQIANVTPASGQQFAKYSMPQRGEMPPINFDQSGSSSSQPKKQKMGDTDNASDDQSISGNGLSNDTVDGSVVDGGDAYAGDAGDAASSSGGIGDALGAIADIAYAGKEIKGNDYRQGGKVPGKAVVKGDHPVNDIVPARLSPGEVVLPRSIALKLKNAPDKDFNEHLNKIVGPFIRKSQAMADGGEIMDIPKATPAPSQQMGVQFDPKTKNPGDMSIQSLPASQSMIGKRTDSYAKGGSVKEHDKKNLTALDKAFHNFIKEESSEGYDDGGQVDDSAGKAAVARKRAILKAAGIDPSQSDDEMEIEADESARRKQQRNPYDQPDSAANGRNYDDGGEVDPFSSIDPNSNIDPSHQQTGGDESAASVIAQAKNAQPQAGPASYGQYDADDSSDSSAKPDTSGGSDGISAGGTSSPISLANNQQMQSAAAGDAGASAAPPPRGAMAANTYAGPPQQKSSGGGGSSMMSMLPMLAMLANKGGEASMKRLQKFDDGGQVEDSAWNRLVKNLHEQFAPAATPTPPPSADQQREDKYDKIRHQNLVNMGEANDNDSSATGMAKGGKVKNALSMLRSINGYADGGEQQPVDDSQPVDPQAPPAPDTDDDDDSAIVRANPDSNSGIDQVAQNEFHEDQDAAPADDAEPLDRSREPADLDMVKKDEEDKSPEQKLKEEKDFEDKFKKGEDKAEDKSDQSAAPADDSQEPDLTNEDIDNLGKPAPSATDDDEQPLKSPEDKLSELQKQLRRAQAQRYSILQGAQGAKYGALLAAGIAGHGAKPVGAEYFNSDKLADLPVKSMQEQLALEKDDPTSPVSNFYRQRLQQSLNMKIDDDVSASGLEKMFPQVTKIIGAEASLNAKKSMAEITQSNKMAAQIQKQQWQENQNNLNRSNALTRAKMTSDAMGGRVEPQVVNQALTQVENDPVIKPLRIGHQALSLSKDMLENPNVPVNPQLLNDTANGFTQALALRPGAVTQKRYDQTSINTMKNNLARFVGKYADRPDIDMRSVDPNLYNTLHNYINTLHDDYGNRLESERTRLLQEKTQAFTAMGRKNIAAGLTAGAKTNASGPASAPSADGGAPRQPAEAAAPRTLVKKGYNPTTKQTQFIYSDGSKETKPGKL